MRLPRPRATNATRTTRTTATITAALITVTLTTAGATSADARPWTALFDWQATSTTGSEHWTVQEQDPSPALPGPWYRTWLGSGAPTTVGRGLGVRPLGGRVYDNGDPTQQTGGPGTVLRWTPPGGSTITRAAFGQLRYRNEAEGQYLRVRVATGNPSTNQTRDFGPAYGQNDPDTTYTPSAVNLTPTVPGLGVEAAMFTVCSPAGGGLYTCPNIPTSTGTFGRVGRIEITLDDPDQPVLQIQAQPQIDGGWVNKRRPQKLSVTATDPSSGIQRIQVQLKLGTSTRTLANRVVTCDPLHRTAGRAGLVCPATATLNATDPGRDSSTKDRTYIVTATDYAGNQTVQTFVVRRDLQKPTSGKLGGELARIARNTASGRTGIVPATVTGTDSQSGVARLEILARRQTGGRTYVIATADADCTGGCKKRTTLPAAADLSLLPKDGRYRLQVRVTDQAGNQKTFTTGTLFLDWNAPSAPKAKVTISQRDGSARAQIDKPGRDPAESSGRGDYYLLYPATTNDHGRAIRSGDHQVRQIVDRLRPLLGGPTRIVRSPTKKFPLPGYQLRNNQEPGYILQTDYVRTSSGERRVRLVRVARATVRLRKSTDDIYRALRLHEYESSTRALIQGRGVATSLKPMLRSVLKGIGRGSIGVSIGLPLVVPDSTGCSSFPTPAMFEDAARSAFAAARSANSRASTAAVGRNLRIRAAVAQARRQLQDLQRKIDRELRFYADPCDRPAKVAQAAKNVISPQLQASERHLVNLDVQKRRQDALATARQISRREKVGVVRCADAEKLNDRFGKGSNYVVYWSPPPPPNNLVEYVGISSSLARRCQDHPEYRRLGLHTLKLPHLTKREAHNVEEALLAHFGNRREVINGGTKAGQLRGNKIHSVSPRRADYCARLLAGQALLVVNGYGAYAAAHFTRNKICDGIGRQS